jgi:NADPH-dependent 2,4-dienoyl-CoA reductase/sulfur reductase-like enzyme
VNTQAIRDHYDVAIVGAGPAGLAAARVCADAGLSTVVFDEQPSPGGQIYRSVTATPFKRGTILGEDYWRGAALVAAMRASGAQYVANASVWSLTRDRELGIATGGGVQLLRARRVILCTGAIERPFPIPGWTLPGVMTAGAAQILLKSSALVPQGRVVLAGCGPLLWLLAWQYLNAGRRIDALLDTTPNENRSSVLPHLAAFLFSPYFFKGLDLLRTVRSQVNVVSGVTELRATGRGKVEEVVYRCGARAEQRLQIDTLLLHQGVAPNVNLALSAGIEHRWNDAQLCFLPTLGANADTSVEGIAIAGDGAGIAGAQSAEQRGVLAGVAAARSLKSAATVTGETQARAQIARYQRGRMFLDLFYRPAKQFRIPRGDTVVCRCEEVNARQIDEIIALGCPGPNQMKAFLRCGMGPCQGRFCGLTVTEMIAEGRGLTPQQIGYYRLRPPVKPITVAEMASLPKTAADLKAVVRV